MHPSGLKMALGDWAIARAGWLSRRIWISNFTVIKACPITVVAAMLRPGVFT